MDDHKWTLAKLIIQFLIVARVISAYAIANLSHERPGWQDVKRDMSPSESSNWAGGKIVRPRDANYWLTCISGQFEVPTLTVPAGREGIWHALSIWAGISDPARKYALAQSGISVYTQYGTETDSYCAGWWEWLPTHPDNFCQPFKDFFWCKPGHKINVFIGMMSSSMATITLENLNTGHKSSQNITGTSLLKGKSVEWIVEDFYHWESADCDDCEMIQYPYPVYDTIEFTLCATCTYSTGYDPDDAPYIGFSGVQPIHMGCEDGSTAGGSIGSDSVTVTHGI